MTRYVLTTEWQLRASIEQVFDALMDVEAWPRWWRYVREVKTLRRGEADGVGGVRRYVWSSRLPYRLAFEMRTTVVERPSRVEATASGELNGSGRWKLAEASGITRVEYEWSVDTGKRWMNALAPLLAPVFRWNHAQVMAEGGRGLARYLGATLIANRAGPARILQPLSHD